MTEEYFAYLEHKRSSPPVGSSDYIAHYGVKGQKWGQRNYQNYDGTYTAAGAERYWGGTGQRRQNGGIAGTQQRPMRMGTRSGPRASGMPANARSVQNGRKQLTPEQRAARKARAKKVLAVGAGVAVAAALGYAAYKGSTKLRDDMRADVYRNMDGDFSRYNSLNSKYWNSSDRREYAERTRAHADYVAKGITRRDAVNAKLAQKTGIRLNMPQSRAKVLQDRHEQNTYNNWIRSAEGRAHLNHEISDARKALKEAQRTAQRASVSRSRIQNERYGEMWEKQHQKTIEMHREHLNSLLDKRRAG